MAAQDLDLCTVADVLALFSTESRTPTATVQMVVTGASAWFRTNTNRVWQAQQFTESRNGNDRDRMILRYRPAFALSAVSINGTPILVVTDQMTSGAIFDEDHVYLRGYSSGIVTGTWWSGSLRFTRGIKNCSFTYSAGYQTPGMTALSHNVAGAPALPADIQEACAETVGFWLKRHRNIANESTGEGPERVTFVKEDVPSMVRTLLNQTRTATYLGFN